MVEKRKTYKLEPGDKLKIGDVVVSLKPHRRISLDNPSKIGIEILKPNRQNSDTRPQ